MVIAKGKYHCNTVEQFHIMKWIQANFEDDGLVEVYLVDRDHVRIRDIAGDQAIVSYANGVVDLSEIDEAC